MKKYFLLLGLGVLLGSCSTPETPGAAPVKGSSSSALLYLSCRAVSQEEVEFVFSRSVTIKYLNFEPEMSVDSVENGSTVKVKFKEKTESGKLINANLLAEDEKKNTLNVLVSFRARNDRMPDLVINEVCTETANAAAGKKEEFIEFKTKSAGNLGAMRVVINSNTTAAKQTIYEFSPVEVKKDEYMVLHLRTYNPESKDEYTNNLDESVGVNASATGRDFWIPGDTAKLLHKTAMIYVLDQDDNVLDAVIISDSADSWWTKDYFAETAEFLFKSGAWKSQDEKICSPQDAVASGKTTNTRTICRDETVEDTDTANDWYITDTSNATVGKTNSIKRYLK
ncbi:hypothetical protein [Treponema sp. R6D11]